MSGTGRQPPLCSASVRKRARPDDQFGQKRNICGARPHAGLNGRRRGRPRRRDASGPCHIGGLGAYRAGSSRCDLAPETHRRPVMRQRASRRPRRLRLPQHHRAVGAPPARNDPSGENATELTVSSCAVEGGHLGAGGTRAQLRHSERRQRQHQEGKGTGERQSSAPPGVDRCCGGARTRAGVRIDRRPCGRLRRSGLVGRYGLVGHSHLPSGGVGTRHPGRTDCPHDRTQPG